MARSLSGTIHLIKPSTAFSSAKNPRNAICLLAKRRESSQPESILKSVAESSADNDALAVQRIEDAIHSIIVTRSAPNWLPFIPGASYWVPPRRRSYGIADLVNEIANALTEEEIMSLTTARGWPSSAFFIGEVETTSKSTLESDNEERTAVL